ncbi:MAG: tail fiber protein [Bacteroidota bacterium]
MSENSASAQVVAYNAMPVGTVVSFAGSDAPNGWVLCDGRTIDRTDYPALFDLIGNRLPDLRSRFVVGAGHGPNLQNRDLHAAGGKEDVQLTVAEMPVHQHYGFGEYGTDWPYGTTGNGHEPGSHGGRDNDNNYYGTTSAGGDQAHENMPPWYALTYIIKY